MDVNNQTTLDTKSIKNILVEVALFAVKSQSGQICILAL